MARHIPVDWRFAVVVAAACVLVSQGVNRSSYRQGVRAGARTTIQCVIGGSVRHGAELTTTEESIDWCGTHAADK
jgi:hypothetical protein